MFTKRPSHGENGNILFLILLAVVLFAVLASAVTSSLRGGGKDASAESLQSGVADMLQYLSLIDGTLIRMQVSGGINITSLSFSHSYTTADGTVYPTANANGNCSTSTCKVFDPGGGNIVSRDFEKYGNLNFSSGSNPKAGQWRLVMMQWPQAGTSLNDVVMLYYGMSWPFTIKLNEVLGMPGNVTVAGSYVAGDYTPNWDNAAFTVSNYTANVADKTTFVGGCAGSGATAYCNIYHLVIAR